MKRIATPRPQLKLPNHPLSQRNIPDEDNLDEFLTFGSAPERNDPEETSVNINELMTVYFEMNGRKVTAKMSTSMVQFLNDNENLRQQIIEKLLLAAGNSNEQLIVTEGPSPVITNGFSKSTTSKCTTTPIPNGRNSKPSKPTVKGTKVGNTIPSPDGQQTSHLERDIAVKVDDTPPSTSSLIDLTKHSSGSSTNNDDIPIPKWDSKAVNALLESYGIVADKLKEDCSAKNTNIWRQTSAMMENMGYTVTEDSCEKKYRALKETYLVYSRSRMFKEKTPPWEFFNRMKDLMLKETNTTYLNHTNFDVDDTTSSDLSSGVDDQDDNFDLDHQTQEQPRKKRKISTQETWGIELFRRTYLQIENKKFKEMKATRKLLKQQCLLQSQRNVILSSIVEIMKKK